MAITLISINITPLADSVGDAIRHAAFQVGTVMSTTGYATTDFNQWPIFSKAIIFLLMFMGGCAGSTAGGFKCARVILLIKKSRREVKKLLHPRSVNTMRFEGKTVDNPIVSSTSAYLVVYIMILCVAFLLLSLDGFDFETTLSASVSCLNNVGPAFGAAGPASSYAAFSPFSKLMLSFLMLFGRLEIYPMLIALSPSTWSKK